MELAQKLNEVADDVLDALADANLKPSEAHRVLRYVEAKIDERSRMVRLQKEKAPSNTENVRRGGWREKES